MKLRIKGNSLRLRLSRSEVKSLLDQGRVEDAIVFGASPEARLTYAVQKSEVVDSVVCDYAPQKVTILIPAADVACWSEGDAVSISARQNTGSGMLDLLIEKDFACLDRSDGENEGTFPNPNAARCS